MTALALAYAGLALLAALDWYVAKVHIGALAVLPLILIAYFGNRTLAIVTSVPFAALFAMLDHDVFTAGHSIEAKIPTDAAILGITFFVIIVVVERLRRAALNNTLLQNNLEHVRRTAERDVLTKLPNRTAYSNRLEQLIAVSAITNAPFAVLFADLDGFKAVNDAQGHDIGDRILILAGERIRYAMRSADMVSRIGGDEFAALLESVSGREEAAIIARKIEEAFGEPFRDGASTYQIGITVGVSIYGEDGVDEETLLRMADQAMYARKRLKKADAPVA
ncbi:MAG: GGDEF domain-containing protein [Candidatus Eremiobacteraeota bacterium]|nr:GGDEF domain-containing protein [Candidatus Eremiobacteraeota bacterium]